MTGIRRSRRVSVRRGRSHVFAAVALALLIAAGTARAEPTTRGDASSGSAGRPFSLFSPQEASFRLSYGIADRDSLHFYTLGPRVAYDLPDFVPALLDNRFRIAIEVMGSFIHGNHHDLDGEFAFSPLLLDYRFDRGNPFVPFFEGGEGIVLTTLKHERLGGPFEFSSQVGGGVHFFYTTEDAVTVGARYRHISNSGIKDDNRGLNTFFITVGIGHFPDRR
jgi:hypothetical protein